MSNIVWSGAGNDSECVRINNGLTDVFINVLDLSGSNLAQTAEEKRLIVWLAEKDQSKVGMGTVGFDVCEMPWNIEAFKENKTFLLNVIEGAKNKSGWELLEYTPNEELLFPCLDMFAQLISKIGADNIKPEALKEWLEAATSSDPVLLGFPQCPKHGALLSCFGCQICNN
ncbi:MAG: hypothetical protein K2K41_05755 [Ruminiclostridium sp.]|nr:hypothetical protein [Ruminiclostridium sp.]